MDESVEVVVSGHLCLDLIPRMEHVPLDALAKPGMLSEVGPLDFSTGGAVSNTGLALHRLGVNVRLMAVVGDDLLGKVIISCLDRRDPVLSRCVTVRRGQSSSYTLVLSPLNVDRMFLTCVCTTGVFGVTDVDFSLVAGAKIFHLGYPPLMPRLLAEDGAEFRAIFQQAKAAGVVTSVDMSLPDPNGLAGRVDWAKILRNVLPYVDIFVPSIEEILFMLRRADYDSWRGDVLPHLTAQYLTGIAAELLDMGAVITGFKLGEIGIYLQSTDAERFGRLERLPLNSGDWASSRVWSPAFAVSLVGTTGAGDAAYAGLLAALLRGMNPHDAARWACAVGGCCVEAADATSGVRAWADTQARMEAGWPSHTRGLPGM